MNTTNTLLIIIVVLLVGFGVWYFTNAEPAPVEERSGIEINLEGSRSDSEN